MSQRRWHSPIDLESMALTREIYELDRKKYPETVWNGLNGAARSVQSVTTSQTFSGRLQPQLNLTAIS